MTRPLSPLSEALLAWDRAQSESPTITVRNRRAATILRVLAIEAAIREDIIENVVPDAVSLTEAYEKGRAEAPLDVAWQKAEAALPEGWRFAIDPYHPDGWEAYAYDIRKTPTSARSKHSTGACWGSTPEAALLALAAALKERGT